jgi:hypothetical protein
VDDPEEFDKFITEADSEMFGIFSIGDLHGADSLEVEATIAEDATSMPAAPTADTDAAAADPADAAAQASLAALQEAKALR